MTQEQMTATWIILPAVAVVGLLILFWPRKRRTPPPPIPEKRRGLFDFRLPRRPAALFVVVFFGLLVWWECLKHFEPLGYDPFSADARDLKSVTILPRPGHGEFSLVSKKVVLTDSQVEALCDTLRQAKPIEPNHPGVVWTCYLRLEASDSSASLTVRDTGGEFHGVLVYWESPNIGYIRGTYRCDPLGPLLESITGWSPPDPDAGRIE